MVAVTYGTRRLAPASVTGSAAAKTSSKTGFFTRLANAIEASQMKRAERDLARYRHLLPTDHELHGRLDARDDLPFKGGW